MNLYKKNLKKLINNKNFVSTLIQNVASIYTLNVQGIKNSVILNYDSEIAQIKHENIIDQISEINLDDVDGLFVSCTALKIVDVLDKAEQKFQTTIVSSNQAIIWDCLRLVKVNTSIKGFGKLLLN